MIINRKARLFNLFVQFLMVPCISYCVWLFYDCLTIYHKSICLFLSYADIGKNNHINLNQIDKLIWPQNSFTEAIDTLIIVSLASGILLTVLFNNLRCLFLKQSFPECSRGQSDVSPEGFPNKKQAQKECGKASGQR